jgi:hypothetical protein
MLISTTYSDTCEICGSNSWRVIEDRIPKDASRSKQEVMWILLCGWCGRPGPMIHFVPDVLRYKVSLDEEDKEMAQSSLDSDKEVR